MSIDKGRKQYSEPTLIEKPNPKWSDPVLMSKIECWLIDGFHKLIKEENANKLLQPV